MEENLIYENAGLESAGTCYFSSFGGFGSALRARKNNFPSSTHPKSGSISMRFLLKSSISGASSGGGKSHWPVGMEALLHCGKAE
jgi:hypothetical protein